MSSWRDALSASSGGTGLRARRSGGGPSASHAAARGTPTASGGHGRGRPARLRAALDATLVGEPALTLREELLPFAAALLALGACITSHTGFLDAAPLARAAAVVGLRGHVLDARHLEAGGLEGADRGLPAGAGTLHEGLDLLKALLDALAGSGIGRDLRGERRRLAGAPSGRRHRQNSHAMTLPSRSVRETIVLLNEVCDVGLAGRNVLLRLTAAAGQALRCGHYFFPTFFLPATGLRLGPLRVRALF